MKTARERQRVSEQNVAEIKRRIRKGTEAVTLWDGRVVNCVDASTAKDYRWTGSGLVWYAGKVIERIDYQEQQKESNMSENGYQGYKNYQTWAVALWIGNEYNIYHYWQRHAKAIKNVIANGDCDYVQAEYWTTEQGARFLLADELKDDLVDTHPLADSATMYSDILGHALACVDWEEVADSILDE